MVAGAVCGSALALFLGLGAVARAEVTVPVPEVPVEEVVPDVVVEKPVDPTPVEDQVIEELPAEEWIRFIESHPPGSDEELMYYTMIDTQRGPTENPEPSSLVLAGVGLSVIGWYSLRRRQA
jgi:hypothetical protein